MALKQSGRRPQRRIAWIATGLTLFGIEALLYTAALQRLDVSVAYSLGGLSFVTVSLLSVAILSESVSVRRRLGLGFIVAGCAVLAMSG